VVEGVSRLAEQTFLPGDNRGQSLILLFHSLFFGSEILLTSLHPLESWTPIGSFFFIKIRHERLKLFGFSVGQRPLRLLLAEPINPSLSLITPPDFSRWTQIILPLCWKPSQ
jgi:hypothetical protein